MRHTDVIVYFLGFFKYHCNLTPGINIFCQKSFFLTKIYQVICQSLSSNFQSYFENFLAKFFIKIFDNFIHKIFTNFFIKFFSLKNLNFLRKLKPESTKTLKNDKLSTRPWPVKVKIVPQKCVGKSFFFLLMNIFLRGRINILFLFPKKCSFFVELERFKFFSSQISRRKF